MRLLTLALAALMVAGCSWLEPTPEERAAIAAARAEGARQAALPVAQASCSELQRRSAEAEDAIDDELRRQAEIRAREEAFRAVVNPRIPPPPPSPQEAPRSMATEYAIIAAVSAEQARRCSPSS